MTSRFQPADTVSSPPDLFYRTPESILYLPVGTSLHVLGQLAMFPRPQHLAPDSHNVTGIADDAVVAGVLCRIDKWNRQFLSAVARAVSANAHVQLWMPDMLTTASSRSRVMRIFASQGLQPERVHWIPTLERNKHLLYCAFCTVFASYFIILLHRYKRRIDLVFDTFPYSGHMTTGDALCVLPPHQALSLPHGSSPPACRYVGAATLVRPGLSMASRISSSLLLSCGASHVNPTAAAPVTALTPSQAVARDAQEWEALATRLLASKRLLQEWKTRTRELCDSSGMWWVSWWVKRFSGTLRLSGTALPPPAAPPLLRCCTRN